MRTKPDRPDEDVSKLIAKIEICDAGWLGSNHTPGPPGEGQREAPRLYPAG